MRKRGALLSTFVISFSDGLILPIVIITVLSRVTANESIVLKIAFPVIASYAIIMGVSIYFTKKAHRNTVIKTETFKDIGLSKDLEDQLLQDHEQEKQEWQEVLIENELAGSKSRMDAVISTIAYILSGSVLLLPFLLQIPEKAFEFSCVICGLLIIIFGILKARVTENAVLRVVLRNLIYAVTLVLMTCWLVKTFTT